MKKIITILIAAIVIAATASGQSKASKEAKLKAHIIALDKLAWEAWKNNNAEWFKNHTTEDFLTISAEGISNKADVVKATPAECKIKSYSLDDFTFVMLNENTVMLTYIAMQDGVCGGKKIASKVRASATYVKRGEKWLEAFYMDTDITK